MLSQREEMWLAGILETASQLGKLLVLAAPAALALWAVQAPGAAQALWAAQAPGAAQAAKGLEVPDVVVVASNHLPEIALAQKYLDGCER